MTVQIKSLGVYDAGNGLYYVESAQEKVMYKVHVTNPEGLSEAVFECTCPDFEKHKDEPGYACKHIQSVMQFKMQGPARPRLEPEFIKQIDGKDFVLYVGLLDLAHQLGLVLLSTEILQFPSKENDMTCIVKADASTESGKVFSDIGDANPGNCNPKVARHLIRMASTRAKARCLRDLTNVGITCLEELGGIDDAIEESRQKRGGKAKAVEDRAKELAEENQLREDIANKAIELCDGNKNQAVILVRDLAKGRLLAMLTKQELDEIWTRLTNPPEEKAA